MWKPIETAPMDGTEILVWTTTNNPNDMEYVVSVCEGEHLEKVQVSRFTETGPGEFGWETTIIGEPTHWMPLPEPPK